jgi:hypothetical protein
LSSVADKDNMWLVNFARLNALSVLEESSPVRPGGRAHAGGPKAVQVRMALKMQVRTRVGLARVMFREVWGAPMVLCQWCMLGRALREEGVRNSLAGIHPLSDWYFGAIGILELCVHLSIARAVIVALRIQQFQETCIL